MGNSCSAILLFLLLVAVVSNGDVIVGVVVVFVAWLLRMMAEVTL